MTEKSEIDPIVAEPEFVYVCPKNQITHSEKKLFEINKRQIVIFNWRNQFYCLDYRCYHMGGPLNEGTITEIEDLDRRPCVTCPWHSYKILLDSGEGIYKNNDNVYQSKGLRQRLHPIKVIRNEQTGIEELYVKVMSAEMAGNELASDHYATWNQKQQSHKGSLNKKYSSTNTKSNGET